MSEKEQKEMAELLDEVRRVPVSPAEQERQRRSFAYGNTHFENEDITRETVDRAAEALANPLRKE